MVGVVTRRYAALALALAALIGLPAAVVGADPSADIPGIPLPGPISTGRLGGPIYDRVYWVDVPAERVLVVSLTGSAGTDFDLYLFDSSATSVYAPAGLVAKSTGPTSTEVLAHPSPGGGRYYIDLSGFSDVEGDFRLTVQIATDSTPPRMSLVLHGGAPATADPEVSVTVIAIDDLSGVDSVQFSLDGLAWGPWQAYTSQVTWSFTGADGTKELWARARDRQGNVSATTRASILLDRVSPSVIRRSPEPNGTAPAPRPTLSVTFSESIRPASWMSFGLILQDASSVVIYGTYGWDPATNTGTFLPASDLQVGGVYVASLGSVVDLAGNQIAPPGSWTVRPLEAPRIALAAAPRAASRGATVMLSGSVDVRLGGTFSLERLGDDGSWLPVEPILPDGGGAFFSEQVVDRNSSFRVVYSGNDVSAATTSPGVRILVRRSISVAGPGPSVLRSASVSQRISVTAILGPTEPAVPVTLTLSRYDPVKGAYRVVTRLTQMSSGGRAGFAWRPSNSGRYVVRLSTPATDTFAGGQSGSYRWIVR
jgi:hypothetical protein